MADNVIKHKGFGTDNGMKKNTLKASGRVSSISSSSREEAATLKSMHIIRATNYVFRFGQPSRCNLINKEFLHMCYYFLHYVLLFFCDTYFCTYSLGFRVAAAWGCLNLNGFLMSEGS